jgi:transposase-like protein
MKQCPQCQSFQLVIHPDPEDGIKHYNCRDCHYHVATVEVPEKELRRLVDESLELKRLLRPKVAA